MESEQPACFRGRISHVFKNVSVKLSLVHKLLWPDPYRGSHPSATTSFYLPSRKTSFLKVQVSLDKYKRWGRSPEQVPQPTGTSFLIEPRADKVGILRNAAKGQAFEPREGRYLIFIARGAVNPTSLKLGLVL